MDEIEAIAYEPMTIREELIALYKSTGLPIGEYSRRVGISDSSIKNLLAGTTGPCIVTLRKMAVYHKVAFLIHGKRRTLAGRYVCSAKGRKREG